MRNESPSPRWLKQFHTAFVAAGGHNGPVAVETARTYAADLYRIGATPAVAARAAFDAYQKLARQRNRADFGTAYEEGV